MVECSGPMGAIVYRVVAPGGNCPQGSCLRGSCPRGSCPKTQKSIYSFRLHTLIFYHPEPTNHPHAVGDREYILSELQHVPMD